MRKNKIIKNKYTIIPWITTAFVCTIILLTLKSNIEIGSLIILSLTLLSIIWYTFFTYKFLKKREQVAISCILEYEKGSSDIYVILKNLSKEVLKVKVNIEVKIDGKEYKWHPLFSGETAWSLTPLNTIKGHFLLSDPIKVSEITLDEIKNTTTEENKKTRYIISLTTKWMDQYGNTEEYPCLKWYFDFIRNSLIYDV